MRKRTTRSPLIGYLLILGMFLIIFFGVIANIKIQSECQIIEVGSVMSEDVKITFFGIDIKWPVSVEGKVDTNKIGNYEVFYKPWLTGNRKKVIVSVVDTQKPQIVLAGESEVTVQLLEEYEEPGYTAQDNYDGNITENVITRILQRATNQYVVEYYVQDSSENVALKTRVINIVRGRVCLTFDDGPSSDITPKILDVLKENEIKATFFVLGYTKNMEEIVRRIYEEGHTIGLHGYSHVYSEVYSSIDALIENFQKVEKLVANTTDGYYSKIIRFPGGASNTVSKNYCMGIMTEAVELVEELGYTFYDWNVDSGDAGSAWTSQEIYENVISGIKPGRLNVVLMHDSGGHTETLEALKMIIEYCKENCYLFEAITSETRPVVQHGVSN